MSKNKIELKRISKFLSYILRHRPEEISLNLNSEGWASISELIDKAKPRLHLTQEIIEQVVIKNDKQRFKLSDDGLNIRASQGHSIKVDLTLTQQEPPTELYHGTATRFINSIKQEGLKPKQRHHVHLSTNIVTAKAVGQRHGKPIILKIEAINMHKEGYKFFLSDNNVWLTECVPSQFLTVID